MLSVSVSPEAVWNEYRTLYRYGRPRAVTGPVRPPPAVPQATHLQAANKLAGEIGPTYARCPIPVDVPYFTYLYLFVQMLRCSGRQQPTYDPRTGYGPLAWYPLSSLAGHDGTAKRYWDMWYRREWECHFPHPNASYFYSKYPRITDTKENTTDTLEEQLAIFRGLQQKIQADDADILTKFNCLGQMKGQCEPDHTRWHPLLILGTPLAWRPGDNDLTIVDREKDRTIPEIRKFLASNKAFEGFKDVLDKTVIYPTCDYIEYIRDGLDEIIEKELPELWGQWLKLRSRYLS